MIDSLGAHPSGPLSIDTPDPVKNHANIANISVTSDDWIVADAGGIIAFPSDRRSEIAEIAAQIRATEQRQAANVRNGQSLREQFEFARFREHRNIDPSYSFRQHLQAVGAAIEE